MMDEKVPRWKDHGTIVIPATALGPGGLIGDGTIEIKEDDPRFEMWGKWMESGGTERP